MEIGGVIMSLYGRHKASYSNSNGQTLAVSGEERGGVLQLKPLVQSNLDFFAENFSFPSSPPPLASFSFTLPPPHLFNRPPPSSPGVAVPSPRW